MEKWEERRTATAAWPLPVPTSQATFCDGVNDTKNENNESGYLGLALEYTSACFTNSSAIVECPTQSCKGSVVTGMRK